MSAEPRVKTLKIIRMDLLYGGMGGAQRTWSASCNAYPPARVMLRHFTPDRSLYVTLEDRLAVEYVAQQHGWKIVFEEVEG